MNQTSTRTQTGTTNPSTTNPSTDSSLIGSDRVEGTPVFDPSGKRIGTIKRLVIDKVSGQIVYAVMAFGGFLGIGDKEFPVPWRKLDYDPRLGGFRTDVTEDQLKRAPSLNRVGVSNAGVNDDFDWSDRGRQQELLDYYHIDYYW